MFTVSTSFTLNRSRIERLLRLPGGLVYRNMTRRVRRAEAEAKRLAPTASVARQITSSVDRGPGGEFRGTIRSGHPASIYLINGTRPHIIRPVRAQALRFVVGGRVVYAKVVHHPGTQAQDYLRPALRAAL